jgi:plasmid stabilization system protein ParE
LIQDFPNIGVQTDLDNVRKLNVGHYAIFYSVEPDFIAILALWDGRQDPDKLKI